MITLNTDQGLVSVNSWEEITSRPGFVNNLDPDEQKLQAVIGRYVFKQTVRCGLSNCHTLHGKGYIALTKLGLSTNIGHDCGRKYFGVDFETMSRKFDRDIEEKNNRESLASFAFRLDEIESRIKDFRDGDQGANRLNGLIRHLRTLGGDCPNELVTVIARMVKARNSTLSVSREATADEIELEAFSARSNTPTDEKDSDESVSRVRYVEDVIAEIRGFDALYEENDLRLLLVINIEQELRKFKDEDIDLMSFERLRHWAKWVPTVDARFEKVDAVLRSARLLLLPDNLAPFDQVLRNRDARKQFKSYLRQLTSS